MSYVHPIFADCAKLTLDNYWKEIFINASQNKFPKGVKYESKTNSIFIRRQLQSGKIITEPVELGSSVQTTFNVLLEVFRERLDIYSPFDNQIKKSELSQFREHRLSSLNCNWKNIKPRSARELLLTKFIISLEEKYSLSFRETKNAYNTLQLGFQLKQLSSSDVVYENMQITEIKGFEYDPNTRSFVLTNPIPQVVKKEKICHRNKFDQAINTYISECKKNEQNYI